MPSDVFSVTARDAGTSTSSRSSSTTSVVLKSCSIQKWLAASAVCVVTTTLNSSVSPGRSDGTVMCFCRKSV